MNTARLRGALGRSLVPFGAGVFFLGLASQMKFGTWRDPGPGLWPTCLALFIVLASAVLLLLELSGAAKLSKSSHSAAPSETPEEEKFSRSSLFPLYAVIALAVFIQLFDRFGLSLPCFVLLLFWTRMLGKERWRVALPVSAGLTAAICLIFVGGLDVTFPQDVLLSGLK